MNIEEEIKPFLTKIGAVNTRVITNKESTNVSGNALCYNAMYYVLLNQYGLFDESKKEEYRNLIKMYIVETPEGKVFDRTTEMSAWQNSWDDYTSVICSLQILDKEFAKEVAGYFTNRRTFWKFLKFKYYLSNETYHGVKPPTHRKSNGEINWGAFLGRFFWTRCHFNWALGKRNRILEFFWAMNVNWISKQPIRLTDGSETNQHLWRMGWLMTQAYKQTGVKSIFCSWAIGKFKSRLRTITNDDIRTTQLGYWDSSHPVLKYLKTSL